MRAAFAFFDRNGSGQVTESDVAQASEGAAVEGGCGGQLCRGHAPARAPLLKPLSSHLAQVLQDVGMDASQAGQLMAAASCSVPSSPAAPRGPSSPPALRGSGPSSPAALRGSGPGSPGSFRGSGPGSPAAPCSRSIGYEDFR